MASRARLGAVCACVAAWATARASLAQQPPVAPAPPPSPAGSAEQAPAPSDVEPSAEILPTFTPTGEVPSPLPFRQPGAMDGVLALRAKELDAILRDAAQDLGLSVELSDSARDRPANATESKLVRRAIDNRSWVVSPRLEIAGDRWLLRIVVVPAGSSIALSRVELIEPDELHVRAVVMLRDLVLAGRGKPGMAARPSFDEEESEEPQESRGTSRRRRRSEGRAVLAVNAAVLGGFVGYSLQKVGGSDDARLTYPLLALGTGIGVGGSLIVSEEWDVGVGDAWYLSAGTVWPSVGGLLVAKGRDVQPETDRYAWGLVSGLGGLTLASVALTFRGMGEAGAAMTHSGGLLGMGFGAGTELLVRGTTTETPYEGMGYGAIAGTVVAGAVARQLHGGSVSRVLMIDVGTGLGALSVAAVASPLLIGDEVSEARQRAWVAGTMGGALVGGALAWWITDDQSPRGEARGIFRYGRPQAGIIAVSRTPGGASAPAYGVSWSGTF